MSSVRNYQLPYSKTIRNIIGNYIQNEKALVNQLYFKACHGAAIGGFREDIWRGMFEQIVPKKFVIEQSVFIIDSSGRVSNEVDLAIFDETYTPYIFRFGKLKFLPIEAVAVAVECKSTSLDQDGLKKWAESIAALKTSRESYTRTIKEIVIGEENNCLTQTATRPLRVLCCLKETVKNKKLDSGEKMFDFVIRANKKGLQIETDETKENLRDWYLALNHANGYSENNKVPGCAELEKITLDDYRISKQAKPVSLLTLNLQLNQLLMLINNPILFPHKAYAKMFNDFGNGGKPDNE